MALESKNQTLASDFISLKARVNARSHGCPLRLY
jgi:hypothetical protein